MMTGESVPADVAEGDAVTGGTIALTGRLVVRAVRVGRDTQLAQLIALVERAQADKAAVQRLADRVSGVFVPAVLVLAAATLAGWLLAGAPAERAVSAALAVSGTPSITRAAPSGDTGHRRAAGPGRCHELPRASGSMEG